MLGVIGLDTIGLEIPIVRQIIGFIYITFIPGSIILRILKIHNIYMTKFILYSAGLSIAFVMFSGALIDFLFPFFFKISQPISTLPLMATMTILVAMLCVIAYIQDREFEPSEIIHPSLNIKTILYPSYFLILLLPFIAVFGTFFINFYQNNIFSLLMLFIIAFIAALIIFDKLVPVEAFSFAIYAIAISSVLHVSLISPYIYGWNIDYEYHFSELVAASGYWDNSLPYLTNSLLSITMLAPVYSKMLGISTIWIIKAIYPFIHALLPLAIFAACSEQMDAKKAFFSAFFFISVGGYFSTLSLFRREQIALLFLALLVLVMLDTKLNPFQKSALTIAFVITLPVSHYGTCYLSMMIFFLAWAFLYLTSKKETILNKKNTYIKLKQKNTTSPSILKLGLIIVGLVTMLFWFMYIAGGVSFNTFTNIVKISINDLKDFFILDVRSPVVYQAFGMGLKPTDVLGIVFRIIHYSTEICIVGGFVALVLRPRIFKLIEEYKMLLLATGLFLFGIMLLPYLGKHWNTFRFYNFTLVIIAPFIAFGCEAIWKLISYLIDRKQHKSALLSRYQNKGNNQIYLKFLALFILIPYFLFNTGFIHEVCGDSKSPYLSPGKFDVSFFNEREVSGAEWLGSVSDEHAIIAVDSTRNVLISFWFPFQTFLFSLSEDIPQSASIYLGTWNIEKQEVIIPFQAEIYVYNNVFSVLQNFINIRNKIYNNGGAQVFASPN